METDNNFQVENKKIIKAETIKTTANVKKKHLWRRKEATRCTDAEKETREGTPIILPRSCVKQHLQVLRMSYAGKLVGIVLPMSLTKLQDYDFLIHKLRKQAMEFTNYGSERTAVRSKLIGNQPTQNHMYEENDHRNKLLPLFIVVVPQCFRWQKYWQTLKYCKREKHCQMYWFPYY